jgi:hypothetical protein
MSALDLGGVKRAAKLLGEDEARGIAANIAKLLGGQPTHRRLLRPVIL